MDIFVKRYYPLIFLEGKKKKKQVLGEERKAVAHTRTRDDVT